MTYRVAQDNDGHFYVIKKKQEKEFYVWVDSEECGMPCEYDFDCCRIDGLHTLTFEHWSEE